MSAAVWTDERIREAFIYDGGEAEYHDPISGARTQRQVAGAIFDAWLEAHDAALLATLSTPPADDVREELAAEAWAEYQVEHGYSTRGVVPDVGADFWAGFERGFEVRPHGTVTDTDHAHAIAVAIHDERQRAAGHAREGYRGNETCDDITARILSGTPADVDPAIFGRPTEQREANAEIVTLCGSTKFKDAFLSETARLTMEGRLVVSVGLFGHTDLPGYDWTTDASDLKRMLDRLHFQKIDLASRVHVVNVGGYYGESTAREIAYARSLGKPVTFMEPVEAAREARP